MPRIRGWFPVNFLRILVGVRKKKSNETQKFYSNEFRYCKGE